MKPTSPFRFRTRLVAAMLGLTGTVAVPLGLAATPEQVLDDLIAKAGAPPAENRGKQLFTARHGGRWSCASCHGSPPVETGRHAATGKTIAPLAPAANAERFTDAAKVEKWFRRNCNDVLGRECTPAEKADVLSWLLTLER